MPAKIIQYICPFLKRISDDPDLQNSQIIRLFLLIIGISSTIIRFFLQIYINIEVILSVSFLFYARFPVPFHQSFCPQVIVSVSFSQKNLFLQSFCPGFHQVNFSVSFSFLFRFSKLFCPFLSVSLSAP